MRCYILSLLLLSACAKPTQPIDSSESVAVLPVTDKFSITEQMTIDIPKIGAWALSQDPVLGTSIDSFTKAIRLRHLLYSRIPFAKDGYLLSERRMETPYKTLMFLVEQDQYGVRCGSIHRFFQLALASFGIKSRYVGLYSDTKGSYVGHSATDVLIDGHFIAMDATFDLTIQDDQGRYIAWSEARNTKFHWSNNGYPWPVGKTDTDWFTTLGTEYLTYIATFPSPDETQTTYQSPDGLWAGSVETAWGPIIVDLYHSYLDIETNEAIRNVTSRN